MQTNIEDTEIIKNKKILGEKEKESILGDFFEFSVETIKIVIISLIIISGIRYYIMQPFFVSGNSMEQNFHNGDYLIVDEISYRLGEPMRGDVIIFHYPNDPREFFIKRVIGLPGEKILIKDNKITIYNNENLSGFILDEGGYIAESNKIIDKYETELKNDEYYVLGDNRMASRDSRYWGALKRHFIVGKALLRAWPFKSATFFETLDYKTE